MESVRPDQQLNEPCIRLGRRKRVSAIDLHRGLPPGAAQPHREGHDLVFLVRCMRHWRRCDIEDRAEPCRADMDVDLIGPDVNAADQGGKEGTLA
jgi:hypothetical protein